MDSVKFDHSDRRMLGWLVVRVASRIIGPIPRVESGVFAFAGAYTAAVVVFVPVLRARYADVIADNQSTVNEGTVLENLYEYRVVPFESSTFTLSNYESAQET